MLLFKIYQWHQKQKNREKREAKKKIVQKKFVHQFVHKLLKLYFLSFWVDITQYLKF